MTKIAIVETKKSRTNFREEFNGAFEFDHYYLTSDPFLKKVLKKDVDIDIDVDAYDWVILVGSESLKYFTKITSITEYSGKLVEKKFLPVINPAMLAFKPEATRTWTDSKESILKYINGEVEEVIIDESIAHGINDTAEAKAWLEEALAYDHPTVALDSETTGLYPRDGHMLGFSMSYNGESGVYVNCDCIDEEIEVLMQEIFNKKTVVFWNAKFDLAFFEYHFNFVFPKFEDAMLLHYLIDETPGTHGLKQNAIKYTVYGDYEKPMYDWIADYLKQNGIKKADFQWGVIPFDVMKTYAAMDALVTFILFEKFKKIKQNKKLLSVYDNILIPGCRFLTDMQDNGVPFDQGRLTYARELMQEQIDEAIATLYKNPKIKKFEEIQGKPFNPNSVIQLRKLLFDMLGLKSAKKTAKGANSTDAEVLTALADQSDVPKLILDIRQKSKIKNTYLDKILPQLDRDSRLRTGFNIHSTTSGRLSSSGKLNMQQLPRDNPIIKGCIKATPGYKIVAMDLTTAEMYIAAVLSGDKELMNIFQTGGDFHGAMAKKVFNLPCEVADVKEEYPLMRQAAKAVSFGILYGSGAAKVSEEVTKSSGTLYTKAEAQETIDSYFRQFSKLKEWIDNNKSFIRHNGFIYSAFGRKRRLPNVFSQDSNIQSHNIRSGLNFLVQSVASDINLLGAIDMHAYLKSTKSKARIFALVHDSILAEVPEDEVDNYVAKLLEFVQMDRGVSILNCPVGCDFDVADDYSLGKFEKTYEFGSDV